MIINHLVIVVNNSIVLVYIYIDIYIYIYIYILHQIQDLLKNSGKGNCKLLFGIHRIKCE